MAIFEPVDFNPFAPKPKAKPGVMRRIDAGARGAVDMLSFGFADELEAGAEALPALAKGGAPAFDAEYRKRWQAQQDRDQADRDEVPVSRGAGQVGGVLVGLGGGAVVNAGRLVPGAALRGIRGAGRALAMNTAAGAAGGALSATGGGSPDDRYGRAGKGAAIGGALGAAAVPIGAALGMAGRTVLDRFRPLNVQAVREVVGRAPQDLNRIRGEVARLRGLGIDPTLVDALDEGGRGAVRAAASRMTPGRQVAQEFGETRALNLPGRMSQQARRIMSPDPRTPREIATSLGRARASAADSAFGAVRREPIDPTDDLIQALRTPHARDAIRESVRRERDQATRAGLSRLADNALDDPSSLGLDVGMADRISRVLLSKGDAAAQAGDNDLAGLLGGLGRDVRGPARRAVPGYDAALNDYAAQSRLMGGAERGEDFLTRNTDEFVADLADMSDPERSLARAAGRRAVERKAGENIGAAPGVARALANAPEQQARNAALLGDDAVPFQDAMRAEAEGVANAQYVAPRFGSKTAGATQDAATMGEGIISTMGRVARGDHVGVAMDWLKSRGMSDQQAEEVVRIATDPTRTDEALRIVQSMGGLADAGPLMSLLRQTSVRPATEPRALAQPAGVPPAVTVETIGGMPTQQWLQQNR